jgi:hypothetical protein
MRNNWTSSHNDINNPFQSGEDTNPEPSSETRRRNPLARAQSGASDTEDPSLRPTDGLSAEQPPQFKISLFPRSPSKTSPSSPETLSPQSPYDVSLSSATEQRDKQRQALMMEVQRRAEAAMVQLKKTPSSSKTNDGSHKKRIKKSQISGPKLVISSDESFSSLLGTILIGPQSKFRRGKRTKTGSIGGTPRKASRNI